MKKEHCGLGSPIASEGEKKIQLLWKCQAISEHNDNSEISRNTNK